ncbi:uncharacterized protein LOC116936180 isoform X1 [Daphnia magna]|uniref:uncharacterized protein LOC116936180 isoform X1 n=1 Tax=Daphnia magna TaxID=35525 RepID=UPI001E1BDE8A|nr:uncharacterized protein LOC116936180 isoform X1 [Daphnia magna]
MQLEKCRWLSLSPLFPYSSLSGEDKERTVHSHHGMPSMAKSTMVSPYIRVSVRHTKNLTTRPPITDLSIRKSASARGGQPYASRLETIRIGLESKGFSGNTVKVLLAGSRTSTLSTYESAWRNWNNWCAGEHHDPMSNDLTVMLDFLTTLHMEDSVAIGQHPLVIRFMKGCYNENPPRPKYSSIWDVEVVFSYMRHAGNNLSLDLSSLTKKLATLLAVSTLLRVSEIASLDKRTLEFSSSGAKIALSKPRKAQTSGPLRH